MVGSMDGIDQFRYYFDRYRSWLLKLSENGFHWPGVWFFVGSKNSLYWFRRWFVLVQKMVLIVPENGFHWF